MDGVALCQIALLHISKSRLTSDTLMITPQVDREIPSFQCEELYLHS
jgi:hypothetical protein